MSETPGEPEANPPSGETPEQEPVRCPKCDFVLQEENERCLMCGEPVDPAWFLPIDVQAGAADAQPAAESDRDQENKKVERKDETTEAQVEKRLLPWSSEVVETDQLANDDDESPASAVGQDIAAGAQKVPFKRVSSSTGSALSSSLPTVPRLSPRFGLTLFALLFTIIVGFFVYRNPGALPIVLIASPTPQAIAAPPTATPTATFVPTEILTTPTESATPTVTSTPSPTVTPLPPREHTLESGQTLVGLAFLYGITQQSIEVVNSMSAETTLFEGQTILIPWPTPTPPLEPIAIQFGDETIVVEPNCPPFYEIQEGDSLSALAARNGLPVDAVLQMNFLNEESIVRPGDQICVPRLVEGLILIPTPGPSPTPAPTFTPAGPRPLFPQDGASFAGADTDLAAVVRG